MTASLTAARERRLLRRRAAALAVVASLLASAGLSGIAQASYSLGGTWGAYEEGGNELNLATRDIFGSDGASILAGSGAHAWVDGPDAVADQGPLPTEFFINGDISCSSEPPRLYHSNDPFEQLCWARSFSAHASTPGPWGQAFPMVATGPGDIDLVFDHWQLIGLPIAGACFTGEVGTPQFFTGPLVVDGPGGESDPVLSVGFKAFIDHSGSGFSGLDFTGNAVYAPLTPDTSAPVVTITHPLDCSVVEAGTSLVASFNCVDPGDSDPNPTCIGDVANGTSVDTSTAGEHSFSVVGTDTEGNTRTRTIRYTVLPATAPETTIDSNPTNPSSTGSAVFMFSGSDNSAVASIECSLDSVAFATCTSPQTLTVGDGIHTFAVRAIDGVGHADPTPATFVWTVDTGRPSTSITVHPPNPSGGNDATFEFEGLDAGTGVVAFECSLAPSVPGTPDWVTAPCTDVHPGTGAHTVSYMDLADGPWIFHVTAIDGTGNRDGPFPPSFIWVIDTAPPGTTINSNPSNPSSSSTATFTFNGTDTGTGVASFQCELDGGGFSACSSAQSYSSLGDGGHTFKIRAIDAAGNVDPTPAIYAWSIVTAVPNVAPTAAVTNGACGPTGASGSITLTVNDSNGDALTLVRSANTNTTLVPNASIVVGGSGSTRTITVTGASGKSGVATLTFSLSDGKVSVPVIVTVRIGTNQNETLNGTPGTDIIFGLGGLNAIAGKAGDDLLCGGSSSDALDGGDGDDILDGGSGNDALAGSAGADILRGNAGNDLLFGGAGNDTLRGDQGYDILTGGSGADAFSGGAGSDIALDFNAGAGDTGDGTIP